MSEIFGVCAVAAVVAVPTLYLVQRWAQGGQFKKDDVRIDGKVVVITGANTGIGRETALDLAKRGGRVYLACRDLTKADTARMEIIHQSGNKSVFTKHLDLTSFESIRKFVDEFKKCESKLHILINNAGVMAIPNRQTTKDGLEMQIGTNHFGHFLLTVLLLDTIKASAPARIINVSSLAHKFGKIHRDDLQLEKSYSRWGSYGQSKLANILFTRQLAKRLQGTNVTVNALHPGAVATELGRHLGILHYLALPMQSFVKTPKSGAQTSIMLAVDPDLDEVSGKYFVDCAVAAESKEAQCDDTAEWLWKTSKEITKLKAN
ncbi:retinol dehydrogenase 12-like isoform X2 [Sitodiplosis mosellana]|nr:retinol dehydrogenase 12-like isoform X2 [Sitodiplosis mosellana]XP_055310371.1 retinol dehydrogenase 12-like isoform X2 [Sitodiplosis mosellana]XP_055310372.1 retinol dehydrogenase 12-like isoform X2 [Sitodiplosis mosellana]XP_055310373.1 retinol dehydrogenase 12-like isoform X2 [Sitodiplosis mosellana]